jgi:hypothetical protein
MVERVIANSMAFTHFSLDDAGVTGGMTPNDEERGIYALAIVMNPLDAKRRLNCQRETV